MSDTERSIWKQLALVLIVFVACGAFWLYSYYRFEAYDFLAHTHVRDIHNFGCELRKANSYGSLRRTNAWDAVYYCPLDIPLDSVFHTAYVTHPSVDYFCHTSDDGSQHCSEDAGPPADRHATVHASAERPDSMRIWIMCGGCLLEPQN